MKIKPDSGLTVIFEPDRCFCKTGRKKFEHRGYGKLATGHPVRGGGKGKC